MASSEVWMRQCEVIRGSHAEERQVVWLPESFARVGRAVSLRDKLTHAWDDGWQVARVYSQRLLNTEITDKRSMVFPSIS